MKHAAGVIILQDGHEEPEYSSKFGQESRSQTQEA